MDGVVPNCENIDIFRKQLGGKLGSSLQDDLGVVTTIGDLLGFTEEKLQEHYGVNTG
jgi:DNA polymerase eta